MKTNNQPNCNDPLHIFDVIPGFANNAAITVHQGVRLSCYLTTVTPEIAEQVLLTQTNNRNIVPSRVVEYRRRMERDEWVLAEPWLFDEDGMLIDGQHRAKALSQLKGTRTSIPVLMVQGWPSETQSAVDIGYARTIASIAQLQGIPITDKHLSVLKAMFLFSERGAKAPFTSPVQAIDAYLTLKESIDFVTEIRSSRRSSFYAPLRAVVALAYPYENHAKLDRFLDVWDSRVAGTQSERSIVELRSSHEEANKHSSRGRDYRQHFGKRAISALCAFLKDESRSVIRAKASPWPTPNIVNGVLSLPKGYPLQRDKAA